MNEKKLISISKLLCYYILVSTTAAGSGHPTSSLSAVELMATLFFNFYRYDLQDKKNVANDRIIFSKGHASPLLYALFAVIGELSEADLLKLRTFDSPLEGHPSMRFAYTEVATGSLGQGLSIALGMALANRLRGVSHEPYIYVLLGDSEMAEGQIWEALQLASYYKLSHIVGIVDVNRLGQRGETMLGWDIQTYAARAEAFGWNAIIVNDGHDSKQIQTAYKKALSQESRPSIIFAKTIKGKGVSLLENKDNWHGKALNVQELRESLKEIGDIDTTVKEHVHLPYTVEIKNMQKPNSEQLFTTYKKGDSISVREAYGYALNSLGRRHADVVALDAEMSNSTFSEEFKRSFPARFFEMFIAEQNMVSTAVGISSSGYKPFVSTFGAFFTRAFDQIRMAQYSNANIKLAGSHVGVSIGVDGPSQMALEDIAMMRSINESVVLYPSDAASTSQLVKVMYKHVGISYLRMTREKTKVLYDNTDTFFIGGSHVFPADGSSDALVVAAGITLHEALYAQERLKNIGVYITVMDCYSIKPLDSTTLRVLVREARCVVTVEDHYIFGGLGEAVQNELVGLPVRVIQLAVRKRPRSGSMDDLLAYEGINADAIVNSVISLTGLHD
ncbi:transketolase [Candidatus Roizmanbacteria bacterium CG10_big_fil_rev_8_21_14_0_10_39_6]|uniref:Transketolase n=1 Tax=Candidatus Roizmanbacteria bacterium CG10_big_fil_rev_8_21_14_0_10_39_6 TaxID=1974853 RepID=A0A2M8KS39_9BACT|nr:MAG: transketolase [Candidatus Roizmanbacteria bacterium CG10_big_fil_rev_8_21_14_0_10_39_6]